MNIKNNISYRNSDSPESTLKVKYKYKEGTKTIEINDQNHTPKNYLFSSLNNNRSINRSNILREQHFNSYSNENMDFFRLDYLKEYDRDHYHNKYMSNLTPINRNENFDKLNANREKIRYLDSLKKNFLFKKENYTKNKKDFFKDDIYTSENIIRNNFYKKIDNRYDNNKNLPSNINNRYEKSNYDYNKYNSDNHINKGVKLYKNISIEEPMNYSGAYLSNINDYSIKENQEMNPYNKGNLNKKISKRSVLSKQSHLFCKDVINNDMPALFYKVYDYNINNNGFKIQNNIFSNYMHNSNKPGYITRNAGEIVLTPKNNLTPPKKINFNDNYYSFSSKK